MNHGSSSTDPPTQNRRGSGDEPQASTSRTTDESRSPAIAIARDVAEDEADLERGDDMAATLVDDGRSTSTHSWRGLASLSLSAFSGEAAWRQAQADRNR